MRERFAEVADQLGFGLEPSRRAGSLSIADQQKLELMRAIACDARLIVMDEPTAALSPMETTQLLETIRRLSAAGTTVVFVSHFLREILAVCDEVTVLRDGRHILSAPASATTADHLVRTMIGRELDASFPPKVMPAVDSPEVLCVSGLVPGGAGLGRTVDLSIRRGEIVGLAGLVGSGRTEVCRALFGLEGRSGDVVVDGRPVTVESPGDAIGAGIAMLPESRRDEGLVMRRPIRENVTLPHLGRRSRGGFIDRRRERDEVAEILDRVGVRLARNQGNVGNLSGGNQQKVMFAKWLLDTPRVLIADEPTRGVDVGAKRSIYDTLAQLADEGMAILLVSSEIEELLGLAHRILVMRTGEVVREIQGPDFDKEAVMTVAFGTAESGRTVA